MKILKKPANVFTLKLLCDCGKGEMIYQSSSDKGHLHICNNKECSKNIEINKVFPSTEVEALEEVVQEVTIKTPEQSSVEEKE